MDVKKEDGMKGSHRDGAAPDACRGMKKIREIVGLSLWAVACMLCAMFLSVRVPSYVGVIVFVSFFVLAVSFVRKIIRVAMRKTDEDE